MPVDQLMVLSAAEGMNTHNEGRDGQGLKRDTHQATDIAFNKAVVEGAKLEEEHGPMTALRSLFDAGVAAVEPQWVPIHGPEDLPKEYGTYLISTRDGRTDISAYDFDPENGIDVDDWLEAIIAWQPLPEPYRGDGQKQEDAK